MFLKKAFNSINLLFYLQRVVGKSLIIYLLIRFLLEQDEGKILVSVPTTHLVKQLHSDFCDYETDKFVYNQCYEFASGKEKETEKRIIIATWSMLYRQSLEFFQPFRTFICDERTSSGCSSVK